MKSFPMFIRTSGRRVTIVGGGEQALLHAAQFGDVARGFQARHIGMAADGAGG